MRATNTNVSPPDCVREIRIYKVNLGSCDPGQSWVILFPLRFPEALASGIKETISFHTKITVRVIYFSKLNIKAKETRLQKASDVGGIACV